MLNVQQILLDAAVDGNDLDKNIAGHGCISSIWACWLPYAKAMCWHNLPVRHKVIVFQLFAAGDIVVLVSSCCHVWRLCSNLKSHVASRVTSCGHIHSNASHVTDMLFPKSRSNGTEVFFCYMMLAVQRQCRVIWYLSY